MKLRFKTSRIKELSELYIAEANEKERTFSALMEKEIFPSYRQRGYLTRKDFLIVCDWKTPRTKPHCQSNYEGFIREISAQALATNNEQLRIEIWTLLRGVSWPTASVFLHFTFPKKYPILDFRALWSVSTDVPKKYDFQFWEKYKDFCKDLADEAGVSMRVLDQALWKYSEMEQGSGKGQL